jgi:hypothetical protein
MQEWLQQKVAVDATGGESSVVASVPAMEIAETNPKTLKIGKYIMIRYQ